MHPGDCQFKICNSGMNTNDVVSSKLVHRSHPENSVLLIEQREKLFSNGGYPIVRKLYNLN